MPASLVILGEIYSSVCFSIYSNHFPTNIERSLWLYSCYKLIDPTPYIVVLLSIPRIHGSCVMSQTSEFVYLQSAGC